MVPARGARFAVGILLTATACAGQVDTRPTLDALAERYVRLSLELAQHKPDLIEAWHGPPDWRPGPRRPVGDIRAGLAELRTALGAFDRRRPDVTERPRVVYLRGQAAALDLAARRLLGETLPLADETRAAFGVLPPTPDARAVDGARRALDAILTGSGPLATRHRAFRERFSLPHAHIPRVLEAALAACREATQEHLGLPGDERVELTIGVDSSWAGFARYQGQHRSRVEISGRGPLDVSRALHLACHEGYPGHHVQHVLIDDALVRGRRWLEFQMTPAFGRHLLISEGAAEAGVTLAFPAESRTRLYRDVLFPLAGLPVDEAPTLVQVEDLIRTLDQTIPGILGSFLDSRASRDQTVTALQDQAAVIDPDALIALAERRRTVAMAYPIGRRLVDAALNRQTGDAWTRLVAMFTESPFALE